MIFRVFLIRPSIRSWQPQTVGSSLCTPCRGGAGRSEFELTADEVWDRIGYFFVERLAALERGGIARKRLILDPGMGFFLSNRPEASLRVLAGLDRLKRDFGLPVLVSVSRKSFLRAITGRASALEMGAATLAAEIYAAETGADYIRTHDPGALADALKVLAALRSEGSAVLQANSV